MMPKYKLIKVNKLKENKEGVNKNILKSLPINNYHFNKLYNRDIKIHNNTDKKNNINKFKLLNKLNITNLLNNSNKKSKSFNNKYNTINIGKNFNLIENIKQNKYLIPMIEKNKNQNIINKEKIKEAPFYISDFFSKVRQKTEISKIKLEKKNENINNYNNIYLTRNVTSFDKTNYIDNYNCNRYSHKENNSIRDLKYNIYNNYNNMTETNYDLNNYIGRHNPSYSNDYNNNTTNYNEERIIYPHIHNNEMDNYSQNYYLKKINLSENKNIRNNIRNDFNNYLQNKKLFLIYRAKLFKLLYKSLYRYLNKYFLILKHYSFNILKNYNIKNKGKKIILRFNKYMNNQRKKEENIYNRNNRINTSKSCIMFIRNKNENEIKERKDKYELCRNKTYLKEKCEEIQKRKNIKISEINEIRNSNLFINTDNNKKEINSYVNKLNGVYKKKILECYTGRSSRSDSLFNNNKHKFILNNLKNTFNKIKNKKKSYDDLGNKISHYNNNKNNKKEKNKILNRVNNINKKNLNINIKDIKDIKDNAYILKNKNKNNTKDINKLNKLNNFFIRKIIKNIKSSDKRLFININYVYLSNIQMKGKKEKYNLNILKINNSNNFSIINESNNTNINKDKYIGIIEEESSNINYTNDSNNSISDSDKKNIINSNNNYINIKDKYLFSCVNFVIKAIKRIIVKNTYKIFKKKINIMSNNK